MREKEIIAEILKTKLNVYLVALNEADCVSHNVNTTLCLRLQQLLQKTFQSVKRI